MESSSNAARFGSGQSVLRLEDDALVTGQGRYTDDIVRPGQARIHFLRSPYPHARIVSIDRREAQAMPGVLLVVTAQDLDDAGVKPFPPSEFRRADGTACSTPVRLALARERVRFVGEAVVAIVAQTLDQARNAAEAVLVDYEELPLAVTLEQALAPDAPTLVDGTADNIACESRYGDAQATQAAFARARHVVRLDNRHQRLVALTIEPRSVLAYVDPADGRLTLQMSAQMPSGIRDSLVNQLGIPREQIRVLVSDVGGGFGMKSGLYPEDLLTAYCAQVLACPVKWIAERSEEFVSAAPGRDLQSHCELALDETGRILALRVASHANVGAYATGVGTAIQLLVGPWVQTGTYDIKTVDFHFTAVLTNTTPTGAYRGAGRPEAIFNLERLVDEAARQSGIDRIALRRRNFITPQQMPYTNPMRMVYDSGKFESVLDQGLALADWQGFEQRSRDSARRGRWRGLGIATFLEWTGGSTLEERVTVTVLADGMIEVFSAVNAMGQGIQTSLAQLVVEAFGVAPAQVRIVLGDTDRGDGFGSAGSRSIFTGGSAVRVGSERTIAHARELAAQEFEVAVQDVHYAGGMLSVQGTDIRMDLFTLAGKQREGRIFLESTSAASGPTWPNGCHVSEVEIDPQTGAVAVVAYANVNDVGRVINPMIVRGQLEGGAVQGIGQALCEQVVYDAQSGQPLTGSLMDYAAPRADIAWGFKTEMDQSTPCLTNILGVKGVGELGTIGATPAVFNAVADALARHGLASATRALQMPLTPARLWTLIHSETAQAA